MANVSITSVDISNDDVTVTGTVDGQIVSAHAWLSHLYPPVDQSPIEKLKGCQTDSDRLNYLNSILLAAAGETSRQILLSTALTKLIQNSVVPTPQPVVIDPGKLKVSPVGAKGIV